MCERGWCFSINIWSKLSLLPLLVPFGCSWLLRSRTGGLLQWKFITLSLLLRSRWGVERKPEQWVVFTGIFISVAILSMHGEAVVLPGAGLMFTFNLAQPLLKYKLWLCPGSFLGLLFHTWRKCLYNPDRLFFDVAATWILRSSQASAFKSSLSLSQRLQSPRIKCGSLPHLQHILHLIRKT